jgi:membrane-bound metal-dependent hydrolase YbcI (DUF457 family)
MDTITHGIAGALIGKALYGGGDIFSARGMTKQRVITWSLMFGAIFPDSDVLRDFFSSNQLLIITWHRSITHSLLCLPLWALLLAGSTRQIARWRKWESPSFAALMGIYAVGILSHIFLDLVTTFGTMIWSPLRWSRPAWDLLFIVDFTFTALILFPQLLAWVYEQPQRMKQRALLMWVLFAPAPVLIAWIGLLVGAPISRETVILAILLFTALFLLPALLGWGHNIKYSTWNRAGMVTAAGYLVLALFAHHVALQRVQKLATLLSIEPQSVAALPLPPSLWHWNGLVRAPRGVYEFQMDLSDPEATRVLSSGNATSAATLEHTYFPDALSNPYIDATRHLSEVQAVLWFARFPVTHFYKDGTDAVVEFSDLRFHRAGRNRPASFTYRVRLSADGTLLSQGWVKD